MIPVDCPLCPQGESPLFLKFKTIEDHLFSSHADSIVHYYACPHCPEAFRGEEALQHHLSYRHRSRPYQMTEAYLGLTCSDCGLYLRLSAKDEWSRFGRLMSAHSPAHLVPLAVHATAPLEHEPQIRQFLPEVLKEWRGQQKCRHCKCLLVGRPAMKKHLMNGGCIPATLHSQMRPSTRLALTVRPLDTEEEEIQQLFDQHNNEEDVRPFVIPSEFPEGSELDTIVRPGNLKTLKAESKKFETKINFKNLAVLPILTELPAKIAYTPYGINASLHTCESCRKIIAGYDRAAAHKCKNGTEPQMYLLSDIPRPSTSSANNPVPCPLCQHMSCSVLGVQTHLSLEHDLDYRIDDNMDTVELQPPASSTVNGEETVPMFYECDDADKPGLIEGSESNSYKDEWLDDQQPGPSQEQMMSLVDAAVAPTIASSRKRPSSSPDNTSMRLSKHARMLKAKEIASVREAAADPENFIWIRQYIDNFCTQSNRFEYNAEQRRATRLEAGYAYFEGQPTPCLFCHSLRGFYTPPADDREEWIRSFLCLDGDCDKGQKQLFEQYYKSDRRVCGRHFDPSEISEEGALDSSARPHNFVRKCIVCEQDIAAAGMEMPIYFEGQLNLLANVPGCRRSLQAMREECAREVQFACPADVLIATEMFPDSLPPQVRASRDARGKVEHPAFAEEQCVLRVPVTARFTSRPSDHPEESVKQAFVRRRAKAMAEAASGTTMSKLMEILLENAPPTTQSANTTNEMAAMPGPSTSAAYAAAPAAVVRPMQRPQQQAVAVVSAVQPVQQTASRQANGRQDLQQLIDVVQQLQQKIAQQPRKVRQQQHDLVSHITLNLLAQGRRPAQQQPDPTLQEMRAFLQGERPHLAPNWTEEAYAAHLDRMEDDLLKALFYSSLVNARNRRPAAAAAHAAAPVHLEAAAAAPAADRWTEVPARHAFECRLCIPVSKDESTPRVRFEASSMEEIFDILCIPKGSFRRNVLTIYWRDLSPREIWVCKAHVTSGPSASETGECCEDCGQHCLNEERMLHKMHHDKTLRLCCRECCIPLQGGEMAALRHMIRTHEIVIPTELKLDCPFKGDDISPCTHTSSSIEKYRKHLDYYHVNDLRFSYMDAVENHACGLYFKTREAKELHIAQVERERRLLGITHKDAPCCPLCGSINLWEGEIDDVKVSHFSLHALEWTWMCRYDLFETRRGKDAQAHYLLNHYERQKPAGCKACPVRPLLQESLVHADEHLLVGLSDARGQQHGRFAVNNIKSWDNSRALLGLDKIQ